MKRKIHIFPDLETLNQSAAEMFIRIGNEAINQRGQFTVSLAGGSTPKTLYKLLASENFKNKINWKSIFFFFGDERNVLPDSDESNFKMANETLFQPLSIDTDKIYRWYVEINIPEKIAEDYAASVEYFFRGFPKFDLILLGMGDDGHTASLFPFTEALNENKEIAVANYVEKFATSRLTLTFPVFNNAANILFLVAGENKAETLRTVLEGDSQPEKYPSQNINPENGSIFWLVDANAAKMLSKS